MQGDSLTLIKRYNITNLFQSVKFFVRKQDMEIGDN